MKKSVKICWIITAVCLAGALAGGAAARLSVEFADWYAFNVYPIIVNVFARFSGLFPFSLAEIVIMLAIVLALFLLVRFIVRLVRLKGRRGRVVLSFISGLAAILSAIAFTFVYACGINYSRSPFSVYSGLKVEKYTKEQLYDTLMYMIGEVNSLSDELELDGDGACVLPDDLYASARAAMNNISLQYPSLTSFYPDPKPVMISPLWCYTEIVGTFTFFTMEANYNTCERPDSIGYTLCHELSHMTGFMREDEANFISYIACRESGDVYLKYSGCHNAMKNLMNAYYREVSYEDYAKMYAQISPVAQKHIAQYSEFWAQYDTPVATVSTAINDTYLKINDQSDGTKSYGRMVDLVIAEYIAKNA